jgi:hypothetical protein
VSSGQRWAAFVSVVAVAAALLAIVALDIAKGGEANPGPYLGETKNERFSYRSPTPVPTGVPGTAVALPTRPTGPGPAPSGDAAARDEQRRLDLLTLVEAAGRLRERDGSLPETNNNVQTLCAYEQLDQGCKLRDILDDIPSDPLGDPVKNGYWYSSDGLKARFYASMEGDLPEDQRCTTEDEELLKRSFILCIETP